MKKATERLRGTRVSLPHLLLVASASALVSALIVISATAQTGPEKAVIAALRERHVIHARAPAPAPAATTTAAPAVPATSALAPAPSTPSASGGNSSQPQATPAPASTPSPADSQPAGPSSDAPDPKPAPKPNSKIKHVFVIALSTPSYQAAFGKDSAAQYLNTKLRPKGTLLTNYRTLGAASMPDYIALVSGQKPNHDTAAGCPNYDEFHGDTTPNQHGLVTGTGCIYPNTVLTTGDELDSANLPWRAYIEGMTGPCVHPDSGAATTASGDYTPTLNPFVFFHSLLDLGDCQSDDLPYTAFAGALRTAKRTPAYSYIAPDACDSGQSETCPTGVTPGIGAADAFLQTAVPPILNSAAYRRDGALIIVFTATPPATGTTATGPVRTGALVLSPYARPGRTVSSFYGPYGVLRTIEDIFGLDALGGAKQAHAFSERVFTDTKH